MPCCPALARTPRAGFYGAGVPMIKNAASSIALALLAAAFLALSGASPARADRCDDLAAQLKNQIDGLTVGKTAANVIYLSHPQAKELSLRLRRAQLLQPAVRETQRPQAGGRVCRPRGQWSGHRLHLAQGRHAERRDPLHQADGADPWRRRLDALSPPRHALRPDQDRGLDRDLAQHRSIAVRIGRISSLPGAFRSPSPGKPPLIACLLTIGFIRHW